jgi:glucose-6-phosphate isomerase
MLELDYTNTLAAALGPRGINNEDLKGMAGAGRRAIDAVEAARKAGRMGFADLPFDNAPTEAVLKFARQRAYPTTLLIGIGGSALGPAALDAALRPANSSKRLVVLDNIDPDFIRAELDALNAKDTLVNVIAKSGVTAETMATFAIVRQWMIDALGPAEAKERFVVTTDPAKGDLLAIARQEGFPVFAIPPNVGGRFSVLSPVGTLPAALAGFNVEALMDGARRMAMRCRGSVEQNPALIAAWIQFFLDRDRGKSVLALFPYSQALWKFAFWFKQLWGESLGKKIDRQGRVVHCGQTPTAALGVTDQHSQLQLFIEGPDDKSYLLWAVKEFQNTLTIEHPYSAFDSMGYLQGKTMAALFQAERQATEMAITEAGRPNATVYVDRVNEQNLGELLMFSQYMTAYAGEFYDIDAFNQPGVEYGKKLTFAMMGRSGFSEYAATIENARRGPRAIV